MFIVYNLIVAPMWFLLSLLFTLISIGVPDKHKELFPQILDFLENIGFRGGFKIVSTYFQRKIKMLTLIFSHDQKLRKVFMRLFAVVFQDWVRRGTSKAYIGLIGRGLAIVMRRRCHSFLQQCINRIPAGNTARMSANLKKEIHYFRTPESYLLV